MKETEDAGTLVTQLFSLCIVLSVSASGVLSSSTSNSPSGANDGYLPNMQKERYFEENTNLFEFLKNSLFRIAS